MHKPRTKKLLTRSQVKPADTWDLASLFKNDDEWEKAFVAWEKQIPKYEKFRGTLGDGPAALAKLFEFDCEFDRTAERGQLALDREGRCPGGEEPSEPVQLLARSGRNAARISVVKISGSSQAAKWPPFSALWK